MRFFENHFITLWLMLWLAFSGLAFGDGEAQPGTILLDGLDSPLMSDLDAPGDVGQPDSSGEDEGSGPPSLDPLEQLGHGEDIGQEESNPLRLIGRQMRTSAQLIRRRDHARSHGVQGDIIADLERLIDQLRDQQNDSAGGLAESLAAEDAEDGAAAGVGDAQGVEHPGEENGVEGDETETHRIQRARILETLDQIWGHLPERVRDQMHSGLGEEFLPQYELLIEAYYQRLAEEGPQGR